MRYSELREIEQHRAKVKVGGKVYKRLTKELESAGIPSATPACVHAERDNTGNIIKPMPVGRKARRAYAYNTGGQARPRVQRQVRRRRTGGVQ